MSQSSLTFNNLTTLGVDRAYLDTFEIELTTEITFDIRRFQVTKNADGTVMTKTLVQPPNNATAFPMCPCPDEWTFQSFPFNTCCDEVRVNINGGAFFSQPMSYIRAKERYMNQWTLAKCYENVCPVHKPICQTETGRDYTSRMVTKDAEFYNLPTAQSIVMGQVATNVGKAGHAAAGGGTPPTYADVPNYDAPAGGGGAGTGVIIAGTSLTTQNEGLGVPTRLGIGMYNAMQSTQGMSGGWNNSIVRLGAPQTTGSEQAGTFQITGWENVKIDKEKGTITFVVSWREPIFCSPFTSKYDANYGRPLYNITSLDFAFNLLGLENMIRVANIHHNLYVAEPGNGESKYSDYFVNDYHVTIKSANLCYQVMTIPATVQKPLTTLVPYRRFVPYITDVNQQSTGTGVNMSQTFGIHGSRGITIQSGVYTLNEMPTAIWVFCAPQKSRYQTNDPDNFGAIAIGNVDSAALANCNNANYRCWDSNKLFAYMTNVNITMANTTQILNTADIPDLYRIAKANGCEDSYWSWAGDTTMMPKTVYRTADGQNFPHEMYYGAGSVLRLKPGVDIIVPDIPLIPGANAHNMVLQVRATFNIPPHSSAQTKWSLWLLFEYVGVACISPGQCEITMNPLGTGEIMGISPVVSGTNESTEGQLDAAGYWDKVRNKMAVANHVSDNGVISKFIKRMPGSSDAAAAWVAKKRGRNESSEGSGGAVIGRGLNDWV